MKVVLRRVPQQNGNGVFRNMLLQELKEVHAVSMSREPLSPRADLGST